MSNKNKEVESFVQQRLVDIISNVEIDYQNIGNNIYLVTTNISKKKKTFDWLFVVL